MLVRDVLSPRAARCHFDLIPRRQSVKPFQASFKQHWIASGLDQSGSLVGVFSERDVLRRHSQPGGEGFGRNAWS